MEDSHAEEVKVEMNTKCRGGEGCGGYLVQRR